MEEGGWARAARPGRFWVLELGLVKLGWGGEEEEGDRAGG